jgi:SAM-dependent methyltransferase
LADALLPDLGAVTAALDLGAGPGRLAWEIAVRSAADVLAMDADPLAVRMGEHALRTGALQAVIQTTPRRLALAMLELPQPAPVGRVSWVCGDVLNPPLQAESFDLVCAVNLIDTVADPWVALGQAAALLRPGGHLLLAQPDAWSSTVTPESRWFADDEESWDAAIGEHGLHTARRIDNMEWTLVRHARMRFVYRMWGRLLLKPDVR